MKHRAEQGLDIVIIGGMALGPRRTAYVFDLGLQLLFLVSAEGT